ncbi:MAG: lyase [Luteolibacter sp.]
MFSSASASLRNTLLTYCSLALSAHAVVLNSPSQTAVNAAVSCSLIDYGRDYTNGAYTNGAWFGGASIVLATASFAGNTSADARLLEQLRFSSTGTNEICANGGYPAQHELQATGMFAIAKLTPRIWNQLTTAEKSRIDLIMKASLISCAFTTSNNNPFVNSQRTLDGDTNLGRDWNPNYREGMLGSVLVAMTYFGGPTATQSILTSYDHAQFVSQLYSAGLTNAGLTFNYKAATGNQNAPTGANIETAVRNYIYYNSGISDYTGIYNSLATDTYGKNVNSGLNNGAGINGSGKINSGAATLPNPGVAGMLKEFDSSDGGGFRSSLEYCYYGYRSHQTNQLVLIIGGYLQKGTAVTDNAAAKMRIGNTDLWYKMANGYRDYDKGNDYGLKNAFSPQMQAFPYIRSLWEDVLYPYHFSSTAIPTDSDGDGTDDATEVRLGLNPASGVSRFMVWTEGRGIRWPSAPGLTFVVQRSSGSSSVNWVTIATVTGVYGTTGFTDPSPPAGTVLYRVGLKP